MNEPYYQDESVTVYEGDCLEVLAELPDASVDAVVTDPPYGLDFMGKHWDTGAVAFDVAVWGHALRVLKPGGHLAAFGGTRTWHRLAAAIEDAGFEIRDNLAWIYGSGFPKSLDVSKAIDKAAGAEREVIGTYIVPSDSAAGNAGQVIRSTDAAGSMFGVGTGLVDGRAITAPAADAAKQWQGWGTALKPAFEPIVLARKPIRGTVAANVVKHGTGALNIDSCRVATDDNLNGGAYSAGAKERSDMWGTSSANSMRNGGAGEYEAPAGRWPANVLLDPEAAEELDEQSGVSKSPPVGSVAHTKGSNTIGTFAHGGREPSLHGHGDEGGASRFFPVFRYTAKAPGSERPTVDGIAHPTVKPLELMRWLVRLITPPGGVVLDPFAGTGTTAEAAIHEHKRAIVIERETDYLPLIGARLSKPMAVGFDFGEVS